MSVDVIVSICQEVEDADKAHDYIEEIVELLQGHLDGTLHSSESNHNPSIELVKES